MGFTASFSTDISRQSARTSSAWHTQKNSSPEHSVYIIY